MKIINRVNNKLYREAFTAAGKIRSCKIEDTIVLAGSPRSGTTLLLETLRKLPGYKAINEPLLRRKVRIKHDFHYRSYIESNQLTSRQQKFLARALRGQIDSSARWIFESKTKPGCILEHCIDRKLIVKFCRITRMLPCLADHYNVRGIAFIIRHPCAVVNSMLRFGKWKNWNREQIQHRKSNEKSPIYIKHLPDSVQEIFNPVLQRITTQAEALAFIWCLDQYLPLIHADKHPWILVPYERLIKSPNTELALIANTLGVEINNKIMKWIKKPSSSVKGKIPENTEDQLTKWKHQLTSRQIDDILSIVEETGLSRFYSDSIEPDYQQLSVLKQNI